MQCKILSVSRRFLETPNGRRTEFVSVDICESASRPRGIVPLTSRDFSPSISASIDNPACTWIYVVIYAMVPKSWCAARQNKNLEEERRETSKNRKRHATKTRPGCLQSSLSEECTGNLVIQPLVITSGLTRLRNVAFPTSPSPDNVAPGDDATFSARAEKRFLISGRFSYLALAPAKCRSSFSRYRLRSL